MARAMLRAVQRLALVTMAASLGYTDLCGGLSGHASRMCLECVAKVEIAPISEEAKRRWGWPVCGGPSENEEMIQSAGGLGDNTTHSRAGATPSSGSMDGRLSLGAAATAVTPSAPRPGVARIRPARARTGFLGPSLVASAQPTTVGGKAPHEDPNLAVAPETLHHAESPLEEAGDSSPRQLLEVRRSATLSRPADREDTPHARIEAGRTARATPWTGRLLQMVSRTSAGARAKSTLRGAAGLSPMDVEDSETAVVVLMIVGICLVLLCVPCVFSLVNTGDRKASTGARPGPGSGLDSHQVGSAEPHTMGPPTVPRDAPTQSQQSTNLDSQRYLADAMLSHATLPSTGHLGDPNAEHGVPLCENMVVPKDVECAVLVPASAVTPPSPGQVHSLTVRDPKGEPIVGLSIVAPLGGTASARDHASARLGGRVFPRVTMNCLNTGSALATCSAQPGSDGEPIFICRPAGEFFGVLERDGESKDMFRFLLTEASGERHLFEVPQARGCLAVSDELGALRAEVLPWRDTGPEETLAIRVGPLCDVGAILCGLICSLQLLQIDHPFASSELVRRIGIPARPHEPSFAFGTTPL